MSGSGGVHCGATSSLVEIEVPSFVHRVLKHHGRNRDDAQVFHKVKTATAAAEAIAIISGKPGRSYDEVIAAIASTAHPTASSISSHPLSLRLGGLVVRSQDPIRGRHGGDAVGVYKPFSSGRGGRGGAGMTGEGIRIFATICGAVRGSVSTHRLLVGPPGRPPPLKVRTNRLFHQVERNSS